jgi:hypothetical protein
MTLKKNGHYNEPATTFLHTSSLSPDYTNYCGESQNHHSTENHHDIVEVIEYLPKLSILYKVSFLQYYNP